MIKRVSTDIIYNFRVLKSGLWALVVISFSLQLILDYSFENIIYNLLISITSLISIEYLFQTNIFLNYPISSLMIFGYTLYYFILPPAATISEGKPVINNLVVPIQTCIHTLIVFFTILFTHSLYRNSIFTKSIKSTIRTFFERLYVFKQLELKQILIITLLIIGSQLITINSKTEKTESEFIKLLQGINYFIFLPYILAFPDFFNLKTLTKRLLFLIFYTFIILIIGAMLNGRSFVFTGLASVAILYFFSILYGYTKIKFNRNFYVKSILFITLLVLLIKPVTKISIAFVLARDIRNDVSSVELLKETVTKYNEIEDPSQIIQSLREIDEDNEWDEYYLKNPFFSRLCNLKYTDNTLVMSLNLNNEDKSDYRKVEQDKITSLLPLPVLKQFGFSVNKEDITSGSSGDFMFYIFTGNPNVIGTFRTGSLIGSLFIIFGWFYPIIIGLISYSLFTLTDSFVKVKFYNQLNIIFSPIIFILFFPLLFCFTSAANGSESLASLLGLFRIFIEKPLLYFILVKISNLFCKLI